MNRNTRIYLDTEFNGFGGELLSMALVADLPGSFPVSWYEARDIVCDYHPWVAEHVVPKLRRSPLLPIDFRVAFHNFIQHFDNPEIICDWHADAEHFCRMLAGADYGSSLDFQCRITILKTPPGQPVSNDPHNALEDADALMRWHRLQPKAAA